MAAADEEDVTALNECVEKLSVSAQADDEAVHKSEHDSEKIFGCPEPRLWGFETRELYKLALNFYKGKIT